MVIGEILQFKGTSILISHDSSGAQINSIPPLLDVLPLRVGKSQLEWKSSDRRRSSTLQWSKIISEGACLYFLIFTIYFFNFHAIVASKLYTYFLKNAIICKQVGNYSPSDIMQNISGQIHLLVLQEQPPPPLDGAPVAVAFYQLGHLHTNALNAAMFRLLKVAADESFILLLLLV